MSTFRKDGYCIIRSGFVQEILSESPNYPYGAGTPNPACGEWGLATTSHKKPPPPVIASEAHVPSGAWGKQSPGR
jgi:hypothetical protein